MHRKLKDSESSTLLSLCLTSGITICQVKRHLIPLMIALTKCKTNAKDDGFSWQTFQMLLGESETSSGKIPLIRSSLILTSELLTLHTQQLLRFVLKISLIFSVFKSCKILHSNVDNSKYLNLINICNQYFVHCCLVVSSKH